MESRETPQAGRRPLAESLKLLHSTTWAEEIEEVLNSIAQAPAARMADRDWQEAAHFLARHCRQALGDCASLGAGDLNRWN